MLKKVASFFKKHPILIYSTLYILAFCWLVAEYRPYADDELLKKAKEIIEDEGKNDPEKGANKMIDLAKGNTVVVSPNWFYSIKIKPGEAYDKDYMFYNSAEEAGGYYSLDDYSIYIINDSTYLTIANGNVSDEQILPDRIRFKSSYPLINKDNNFIYFRGVSTSDKELIILFGGQAITYFFSAETLMDGRNYFVYEEYPGEFGKYMTFNYSEKNSNYEICSYKIDFKKHQVSLDRPDTIRISDEIMFMDYDASGIFNGNIFFIGMRGACWSNLSNPFSIEVEFDPDFSHKDHFFGNGSISLLLEKQNRKDADSTYCYQIVHAVERKEVFQAKSKADVKWEFETDKQIKGIYGIYNADHDTVALVYDENKWYMCPLTGMHKGKKQAHGIVKLNADNEVKNVNDDSRGYIGVSERKFKEETDVDIKEGESINLLFPEKNKNGTYMFKTWKAGKLNSKVVKIDTNDVFSNIHLSKTGSDNVLTGILNYNIGVLSLTTNDAFKDYKWKTLHFAPNWKKFDLERRPEFSYNKIVVLVTLLCVILFYALGYVLIIDYTDLTKKIYYPEDFFDSFKTLHYKLKEVERSLFKLRIRSDLMLFLGICVGVFGVGAFLIYLENEQMGKAWDGSWNFYSVKNLISPVVLLIFVETLSFFFLKQYRIIFNDYKAYYKLYMKTCNYFHVLEMSKLKQTNKLTISDEMVKDMSKTFLHEKFDLSGEDVKEVAMAGEEIIKKLVDKIE